MTRMTFLSTIGETISKHTTFPSMYGFMFTMYVLKQKFRSPGHRAYWLLESLWVSAIVTTIGCKLWRSWFHLKFHSFVGVLAVPIILWQDICICWLSAILIRQLKLVDNYQLISPLQNQHQISRNFLFSICCGVIGIILCLFMFMSNVIATSMMYVGGKSEHMIRTLYILYNKATRLT